jgi:hypothetical protein
MLLRLATVFSEIRLADDQAAARAPEAVRFRRHQPRRPPLAKIKPGKPASLEGRAGGVQINPPEIGSRKCNKTTHSEKLIFCAK